MRAVVQRVSQASVSVEGKVVSQIGNGFLVLCGVFGYDEDADAQWMAKRIANLRVFPDKDGKMNLSPLDVKAEILLVSQFTLCADIRKGNRPSFIEAMEPAKAEAMLATLTRAIESYGLTVKGGVFGAKMQVSLVNDGPVTILLDSRLFR